MGLNLFSSSSFDNPYGEIRVGQPNPTSFKIIREYDKENYSLVEMKYDNCTNYEGHKILLFKEPLSKVLIVNDNIIDPHFSDNKLKISPFMIKEPTEED